VNVSGEVVGSATSSESRVLPRATLADRVADEIIADIYANNLKAGAVLPAEAEMARRFGVSRLVVREAVRTLVAREVLDSGQGRPARVRAPSSHILTQLFEFHLHQQTLDQSQIVGARMLLEGQLAADAARNVAKGAGDPAQLTAALSLMKQRAGDMDAFLAADDVFHSELSLLADNPLISLIMEGLQGLLQQTRRLSYLGQQATTTKQVLTLREHARVASAVSFGDAPLARQAMKRLIHRTLNNVRLAEVGLPDAVAPTPRD
jgi:GntR family transcriptional regulator, transcriptional repressor for pyruvate dehydrogenase complex